MWNFLKSSMEFLKFKKQSPPGVTKKVLSKRYIRYIKKVFLKSTQTSRKNICTRVSFLIKLQPWACNFIKKETLIQLFSGEFWEISKNTFFIEQLRWLLRTSHWYLEAEAYSEPYQTSKMELFPKIVKDFESFKICTKRSISSFDMVLNTPQSRYYSYGKGM